ncbi:MAG: DedA family protein [Gemmatimonadales bacterium]
MVQDFFARLVELPPAAIYGVIALFAAIENIVPLVPADTAIALGAFLTRGGGVTVLGIYAVTIVANVGTAAIVYVLARTAGRRFVQGRVGRRLLAPEALQRIERLYAQHGTWGIFLSRFIPGVRAVVPPFAGLAGLGMWRALLPTAAASALWYGILICLAATFIRHVGDIEAMLVGINRWALIGGLVLVLAVLLWTRWRRV